jgi:hypothetical protein
MLWRMCASQGGFLRTTQRDSGVPVVTVVVIEEEDADAEVESIKIRYQSRYGQSTATAA